MRNKFKAILTICYRRITRKKSRTIINTLALVVAVILLVGYGSIAKTFINGVHDFQFITSSGIKANGYFTFDGDNKNLYNELHSKKRYEIAVKKEHNDVVVIDKRFDKDRNTFISINADYLKQSAIKMYAGILPQNSNEIVLPMDFKELLNENIEIELSINDTKNNKEFKVVGIYEVLNGNANFRDLIVSSDFSENNKNTTTHYYIYDENFDIQEIADISADFDVEFVRNPNEGINVNKYLFVVMLFLSLVIFAVIRNINNIYSNLDRKESSKFKFIGLNGLNIVFINLIYSLLIFIIPIIVGTLLAILIYKYSMPIILSFTAFSSMTSIDINYKLVVISLLIIYLIYFLTLTVNIERKFTSKKPLKLKNDENKLIENRYSARSIKMNKKKYRSIIFSLTITLSLLVTVLVTTMSIDPGKHAKANNIYDLRLKGQRSSNNMDTVPINEPEILSLTDDIIFENNHLLYIDTDSGIQTFMLVKVDKDIFIDNSDVMKIVKYDVGEYYTTTAGIGENYFKYISNKYEVAGKGYSDSGLMYYRSNEVQDSIKVGDNIELTIEVGEVSKKISVPVDTIITDRDSRDINYDQNLGVFNFSSAFFVENFGDKYINMIGIMSEDKLLLSDLEKQLSSDDELDILSYESFKKVMENFRVFLISFGILGSILLFVNSLLNIISTQVSNCISRNKELATLEAIGCSKKRIISILIKESHYYLIFSFILSILLVFIGLTFVKTEITFNNNWMIIFGVTHMVMMVFIYLINRFIIILNYNKISKDTTITERINS